MQTINIILLHIHIGTEEGPMFELNIVKTIEYSIIINY